MVEQYPSIQSHGGQTPPYLRRWWQVYSGALVQMHKNPQIGRELRRHLERQGFESIHERVERLPIGNWDASKCQTTTLVLTHPLAINALTLSKDMPLWAMRSFSTLIEC